MPISLLYLAVFLAASAQIIEAVPSGVAKQVCLAANPVCTTLNEWYQAGKAAGNTGDYYDNRDRGHSQMQIEQFPQVKAVTYSKNQRQAQRDWGGQVRILPMVVVGNSSTAAMPETGGCQARLIYYTDPDNMNFLYSQYRANNLYVYPEHRDHDPGHNGAGGYGDLLPLNAPYLVLSQGSSGSDKRFLKAIFYTLAAFRPDVKARLRKSGMLFSTVQMILRRHNHLISSDTQYLSGMAHPSAFDGANLQPMAMIQAAQAIELHTLPPTVHLQVVEEDQGMVGVDYFEAKSGQGLADTPAAIARVYRSRAVSQQLVVSAEESFDPNDRPLKYHWVLLRGDPQKVKIEPLSGGVRARITVGFHHRQAVHQGSDLASNRVDIGVFVQNDYYYSAPAFISYYIIDSERRFADGAGRVQEIYYSAAPEYPTLPETQSRRWVDFIGRINGGDPSIGSFLFEQQLTPDQKRTIARVSRQLSEPGAFSRVLNTQLEEERRQLELARAKQRYSKADIDRTKQKLQGEDSLELHAQLVVEKLEHRSRQLLADKARRDVASIKGDLAEVNQQIAQLLAKVDSASGQSAEEIISEVFNKLALDPNLVFKLGPVLAGLMPEPGREGIEQSLKRLVAWGIAVVGKGGVPQLVQPLETLDEADLYHLGQFNLVVLSQGLFSDFLLPHPQRNYVDPRLSAKKNWRDVYHYAAAGQLLGWTRYGDNGTWKFDALGRVEVKGEYRPVQYRLGADNQLDMLIP